MHREGRMTLAQQKILGMQFQVVQSRVKNKGVAREVASRTGCTDVCVPAHAGLSPTASLYAELLRRGTTCEQHVQRSSVAAIPALSSRRSVAMESGT